MFEYSWWIRPSEDYGEICPVFRKKFSIDKEVKNATLNITAMGVYEAVLNGKRVGNFYMAPGWTAYEKRHLYQSYDIKDLLKEENCLEVTVGKGWYRGRLVEFGAKDYWGGVTALIAELTVEFCDGTKIVINTDSDWQVSKSPVRFSEIYDGEKYDAAFWDYKWKGASIFHGLKSALIPHDGEYVEEQEILYPKKMLVTPLGERVIDFGQNLTGYIELNVDAAEGDVIEYSHCEELDNNGNFYTENLRSAKQRIVYICREGKQTYKPHFTFMGFRYIRIDKAPKNVDETNFKAIVVHSCVTRTGYFECSNKKVNKLFSNIIWGQKGNFFDIPSDCPQRDERLGWLGDAQIFIKTAGYNFDVKRFYEKWLRDVRASQLPDGRVPSIVPNVIGNFALGRPGWADAITICPYQLYLTYGDIGVIEENIDAMTMWVDYMRSEAEGDLWLNKTHFGDWLAMDNPDGSYKGISDYELISSAFFYHSTDILIKCLKILKRDSSEYENLLKKIKCAFNKRFQEYNTQTECALALYFDIAYDKKSVAKRLVHLIRKNDGKLTTGFLGTPYILYALSDNGYSDVAYSLVLQEEFPSWLFSVNMGATTIWEHWDSKKANGEFCDPSMNSFNHYAYGAIGGWFYEVLAGIKTDEEKPGFENVILEPVPDKRLKWAEASVMTKYGKIRSKWHYDKNGNVHYEFEVPNKATVVLGAERISLEKGSFSF